MMKYFQFRKNGIVGAIMDMEVMALQNGDVDGGRTGTMVMVKAAHLRNYGNSSGTGEMMMVGVDVWRIKCG